MQLFTCSGFLDLFHNPYDGLPVYAGLLATVFYSTLPEIGCKCESEKSIGIKNSKF